MNVEKNWRGFTLVELLVVVAIVVVLACLLLPATRSAREPSRRNHCLNNVKNMSLAILNFADKRKSFPLASTTYFNASIDDPGVVGTFDDGYSWLFQILPEVERQNIYNLTRESVNQIGAAGELGDGSQQLKQGPFAPRVVVDRNAPGKRGTVSAIQIETYICPSFPGREETKDAIYNGERAAVGNYVAIPSTHYNRDGAEPGGTDGTAALPHSLFDSYENGTPKQTAGNGVLVFAQRAADQIIDVDGKPLRSIFQNASGGPRAKGVSIASIRDGSSQTFLFTESREERFSAWISGLSAYVVAADPHGPGQGVRMLPTGTARKQPCLGWAVDDPNGQTSLNVGASVKRAGGDKASEGPYASNPFPGTARFYDEQFIHAAGGSADAKRWYGPSSAHPGVILHAFADGHGTSISEDIDRDAYLHLVTRAGGEELDKRLY